MSSPAWLEEPRVPRADLAWLALAGAAALVVGAAAALTPKTLLLGLAALALVAVMVRRLSVGLAIFVFVSFFEYVPFLGPTTIAKPLGALVVVSWALALARRDPIGNLFHDHPRLALVVVGFTAWAVISVVWAASVTEAQTEAFRLLLVTVLLVVTYAAVRTKRDLRLLMWAFVLGAAGSAAYGLGTNQQVGDRLIGGLLDPNFLGSMMVGAAVLAMFLLACEKGRLARGTLLVALAIVVIAFVQSQSRGAIVAGAAALGLSVIAAGRLRPYAVVMSLLVVAAAVTYYSTFATPEIRERATSFSAESSSGRSDSWKIAWQMGLDHPIFGVGISNYSVVQTTYASSEIDIQKVDFVVNYRLVAHNSYLEPFAELGLVGLGLLLGAMGGSLVLARQGIAGARSAGDPDLETMLRGTAIAFGALLVGYAFLSAQYEKQLWLGLGLLAALSTVGGNHSRPTDPREEPG